MSLSSPTYSLPEGAGRSAFEAAARRFEAARQIPGAVPMEAAAAASEAASVEGAIANAARQTGVDFDFLLAQAQVESALDPAAKARSSSARGLYQFIESTWLDTMKRHGARFGLGALADSISVTAGGTAFVADPERRAEILSLRHDPQVAAWMAAGLAEDNAAHLLPILGRQPDHGELYLAHFLGSGGAGRFLAALQENPQQGAAGLFAKAAAANPTIFYQPDGSERSLAGVMGLIEAKMARAMGLAPRGRAQPIVAAQGAVSPPSAAAWARYGASAATPLAAPAPYLAADETVFLPLPGQMLTGGARAGAGTPARAPLSDVLGATFGIGAEAAGGTGAGAVPPASSARAQAQVRRAYEQLRSLGL